MASVPLGSDLGIESADALKARLADHLDHPDALRLDGGDVTRVHSAGVQLLCAFARDRARSGQATRVEPLAPELQAALKTLGLDGTLGTETNDA